MSPQGYVISGLSQGHPKVIRAAPRALKQRNREAPRAPIEAAQWALRKQKAAQRAQNRAAQRAFIKNWIAQRASPRVARRGAPFYVAPRAHKSAPRATPAMEARNLIQNIILIPTLIFIGTIIRFLPTLSKKHIKRQFICRKPHRIKQQFMCGATQQADQQPNEIEAVQGLLEDNLITAGIPSILALSIASSFIAILTAIIGYIRTKGKKSKFLITSIIFQIINLLLQIVYISFPTLEAKQLVDFSRHRLQKVLTPTTPITSAVALATFVRSQAATFHEAANAIATFKRTYPRTNVDHIAPIPSPPISDADTIRWLDDNIRSVSYWTAPTIKRLYSFNNQQALLLDNYQPLRAPTPVLELTTSDEDWDSDVAAQYDKFCSEQKQQYSSVLADDFLQFCNNNEGDVLDSHTPVASTSFENRNLMNGASYELDLSWFRDIFGEIVGILGAFVVCIVNWSLGKNVDFSTIARNWQGIDFLREKFSTTVGKLSKDANGKTPDEAQADLVATHIETLNNLLAIPHTSFASRADLREELDLKCREVESFLRVPLSSKLVDKSVLFSLYTAANAMRVEIQRASKLQTIRQEPRLVLFYGEGAVGKTKSMQNLAARIGKDKYADSDAQRRVISITARSKYFPLLSGEPIWTVDEVGSSVNYQEEVIFRDIRGLCSSARFGADTAEIQGKDQEATPHVIVATTNTHPDDILLRLSTISGPEACEPSASRMMIFHCERNTKDYGPIDLNNRDYLPCDKTGAMKHVRYFPMRLNHNTLTYERSIKPITFDAVVQQVEQKMDVLRQQYFEHLEVMDGAQHQVQSVSHFVINLFGIPKSGKGRACDLLLPQLRAITNYPIVQLDRKSFLSFKEKLDRRVVLVCDDIFNCKARDRVEQEQQYMDIFNKYLMPGSVIIFITNILPGNSLPRFTLGIKGFDISDFCSLFPSIEVTLPVIFSQRQRTLEVSEPGCLRRMGFTGAYCNNATEDSNISFEVGNNGYCEQARNHDKLVITHHIFFTLLSLFLCAFSYVLLIVPFGILVHAYWKILKHGTKQYTISQLFQRCFEQYQNFLLVNDLLSITRGPTPLCAEAMIEIEAESIQSVYNTLNPVPNIFINRANFMRAVLPWKVFVRQDVSHSLLKVSDQLRGVVPPDTEAGCVEYLSSLRRLLLVEGHNVTLKANVQTVGKFFLENNMITIDNNNEELQYISVLGPDSVLFTPSRPELAQFTFTFNEIACYHMSGTEIVDIGSISAEEVIALRKALVDCTIVTNKQYLSARTEIRIRAIKNRGIACYQQFYEALNEFLSTTTGKVILTIVGTIVIAVVGYGIYRLVTPSKKKNRKSSRRIQVYNSSSEDSSSDDSDSDDEIIQQRGKKGGPKPKQRSELTDDDRRARHGKKGSKKVRERDVTDNDTRRHKQQTPAQQHFQRFMERTRFEVKKMVNAIPQSVKELPDMNGYNEFKNTIGQLHDKISKNELFVVALRGNEDVLKFNSIQERDKVIDSASRCYALALEKHNLVTVGHLWKHAEKFNKSVYVTADEMGTTLYRCVLVKELTQQNRDLSFWQIAPNFFSKKIPAFPNIRKHFIENFSSIPDYSDCIIKRYAENKIEQFLYATCLYYPDRIDATDADGKPYSLEQYGFCWFSFCLLALTTYGDCGLPYYNVVTDDNTGAKQIKLSGIHCMGNVKDNTAIGICALLTQDDFKHFDRFVTPQEQSNCNFCGEKNMRISKPLPEKDESDIKRNIVHEIVWNNDHHAGIRSVVQESAYYFEAFPHFVGKIRKSFGILSQGSQEHSHTHFISNRFLDEPPLMNTWQSFTEEKWGPNQLEFSRRIASVAAINAFFSDHPWIEQYTMFMNKEMIEKVKKGKKRKAVLWWMEIIVHKHSLSDEELEKLLRTTPIQQLDTQTLPKELAEIIDEASELKYAHDVPIPSQNTVKLVGSFHTNQSRVPKNDFKRFAFGSQLNNIETKIPFDSNSDAAPIEQLEQLRLNNYGEFCARVTQSVQFQGEHRIPQPFLTAQVETEYAKHIKACYSGLGELTDKDVMYGFKTSRLGLDRLQLRKSIGWSMQSLFNVTLKEDVIQVNEQGIYSWIDNPAAVFAKQWYTSAKHQVREGCRPLFIYMDLLKMEKLKPTKNFLGRIFCAADLVCIMIQRKFLGSFVIRSTLEDDCVGVGSNPWVVFNDIARNCLKKKNIFTADYKRWDKTVPAWAFSKLAKLLDKANNTTNFSVLFKDMYEAIHVSGNTLYQSFRGMPSGALLTANLNSKINDFVFFTVFCYLGTPYIEISYEEYKRLVYRKFYGDDAIIAVDDSIAEWFNMITVKQALADLFGFVMDSSEKDGNISKFMEWSTLSWCSRYPRSLRKYNFYVGALKRITINSMLHYERINNPPEVFAIQLNNAMFEAAAWEESYFDSIVEDVKFIRSHRSELAPYIIIMTYEEYQDEMYTEGIKGKLLHYLYEETQELLDQGVEFGETTPKTLSNKGIIDVALPLSEIQFNLRLLKDLYESKKMSTNAIGDNPTDFVSLLNLLWQQDIISKPTYEFQPSDGWLCTASVTVCNTGNTVIGIGCGVRKSLAKNAAANAVYNQVVVKIDVECSNLNPFMDGASTQMNMSSADQVPVVKTTGMDVSLTAGSHIFSNTNFAQGITDLNPVSFSLNNIAQTGAPFDIRDSCKQIFQLEGNYIVSGVQGVGTEVFRLSLSPDSRPALHRMYIQMHEDHIPSVDFGVYVGGAAGAIGTIKIGFVRDITKASFSLAEIQQIAAQDISLGQSSTTAFLVRDIRRNGLYRKVLDDPEAYPGIVALVSNPITNVQRNDSVQYPIQVYSRLSRDYQLASPTAINSVPSMTDISLRSYFTTAEFDIGINTTLITNSPSEIVSFPDCGWNTGIFNPVFGVENIYAYSTYHYNNNTPTTYTLKTSEVSNRSFSGVSAAAITYLGFGFGDLPKRDSLFVGNNNAVNVLTMPGFTVWSIQKFDIEIGSLVYSCNQILLSEFGCVIVAILPHDNGALPTFPAEKPNAPRVLCPNADVPGSNPDSLTAIWQYDNASAPYWQVAGPPHTPLQKPITYWGYTFRNMSIAPLPSWESERVTSTFPIRMPQLYQWTFLGTGNNASTSSAPTGMQRLFFLRPGTSLNSSIPVNAPQIPGAYRLCQALDKYLLEQKGEFLTMNFRQDALTSDFQIAYKNGVFLVRNASDQQIRIALNRDSLLSNIVTVSNPQNITTFNSSGFVRWTTSNLSYVNKMATRMMDGLAFQAGWGIAAQAAGGLFGGLAQGVQNSINWDNYSKNQDLNRQMQEQLMNIQGQNQLNLSKQNFEQQLSLKGLTSASAQSGNVQVAPTMGLNHIDRGEILFDSDGFSDPTLLRTGNDILGLTSNGHTSRVLNTATNDSLIHRGLTTPLESDDIERMNPVKPEVDFGESDPNSIPMVNTVNVPLLSSGQTKPLDKDTVSRVRPSYAANNINPTSTTSMEPGQNSSD